MVRLILVTFSKLLFKKKKPPTAKVVLIDLKKNHFRRYLFTLIRLLIITGYEVEFRFSLPFLLSLFREAYSRKIILEECVSFSRGRGSYVHTLSDTNEPFLSPDYFSDKSGYRIPITMHPNQYVTDLWKEEYEESARRNQIFFAGNFTPELYENPNPQFKVINRTDLLRFLSRVCNTKKANSFESLKQKQDSTDFIYMDTRETIVPFEKNRKTLAGFRYMMAFPGANMPLCHNLTEALSVGTVPILQKSYADLLYPPVKNGDEVLIFNGAEDLQKTVERALSMSEKHYAEMSQKAKNYYTTHCTPSAIVKNIMEEQKRIFMLGAI